MSYTEFCESMTDAMNQYAQMKGDCLISLETVMSLPEAELAYTATVCIAQAAS